MKSLGKTIIRLGGSNRFLTPYSVADEIEKIKAIEEIYYVNGLIGEADAMSIAPVAAMTGNPVILTYGKTSKYQKNVKSYAIGGTGVLDKSFDNFSERLSEKNKFDSVTHITHSYKYDLHEQDLKIGNIMNNLYKSVSSLFNTLTSNKFYTSYLHAPEL